MRHIGSSRGSGAPRYGPRKTKPIYSCPHFYCAMDTSSFYNLLIDLSWILAMVAAGLGVVYIFVKPEEKQ
jgi:hypothetical protein